MRRPKVVSVDMFGTLADLGGIKRAAWQSFLGEGYTDKLADVYWNRTTELLVDYFEERITRNGHYIPLRTIFKDCYAAVFSEIGIDFDATEAAVLVARHHSTSIPHDDAAPFLAAVGAHYPLCLSSDADDDMLPRLTESHLFQQAVISERIESYKSSLDKRFFAEVVRRCEVAPEDILHIGDAGFDVIGATQAGITTCWLNRNNRDWQYDVHPDYEVATLIEAASLLGVEITSPND